MERTLETGGERVGFAVEVGWVASLVTRSTPQRPAPPTRTTMLVTVERDRRPFPSASWEPLGRRARRRDGEVVVEDVARSGFDLMIRTKATPPEFVFRWRPRAEARVLRCAPALFRLRARAALMHYPVLWRAAAVSRAPMHAACVHTTQGPALLVGAPGAGKSSVVAAEMAAGRRVVSDNLCVVDPRTAWGLVEPFRVVAPRDPPARSHLRRSTHGRVEVAPTRVEVAAEPSLVVVLKRGHATRVADIGAGAAARLLVTSTYSCGELARFWPFAAILSMATDLGPALPPVADVARALTQRLPCVEVTLARPGTTVSEVLAGTSHHGEPASTAVGVAG